MTKLSQHVIKSRLVDGRGTDMSGSGRVRPMLLIGVAAMMGVIACAQAWAWPWDKKESLKYPEAELEAIMKSPPAFMGREVRFTARFALRGNLFKLYNTRFNSGEHANFAVWGMKTRLWDKASRRNVLPTLYIDKSKAMLFETLRGLERYDKIEVNARIVSTYAGLPWLYVDGITKLAETDDDGEPMTISETAITHVRNALVLQEQGRSLLAARHLESALDTGVPMESEAFVVRNLAKSYAEAGKTGKAIKYYTEMLEDDPEDAEAHLELAKLYLKDDQATNALESAETALKLSQDYPEAYAVKGEALGKLGRVEEALESSDMAATMPGNTPYQIGMAHVYKARILATAGQYADAVREYANAIGDGSDLAGASWLRKEIGLLYEERFDATGNVQFLEDAKQQYDNANVLSNNNDPEGLYFAARTAYKRAKAEKTGNYDDALTLIQESLTVEPRHIESMLLKAEILFAQGKDQEAEAIFEKVANMNGHDVKPLLTLADYYERNDQIAKARTVYEKALRIEPDNKKLLERYAEMSESMGMLDDAKSSYSSLAEMQPGNEHYQWKLAKIAYGQNDLVTAESALTAVRDGQGAYADDATLMLAKVKVLQGKTGEAESLLRTVAVGDNAEALAALSKLLSDQAKQPAEALSLARAAEKIAPNDAKVLDALGWAQVQNNMSNEAVSTFARISDVEKSRATWYHQAVAHYYSQQFGSARMAVQMATQPVSGDENPAEANLLIERAGELLKLVEEAEGQVSEAKKKKQAEELARKQDAIRQEIEARRAKAEEMARQAEELRRKAEELTQAAGQLKMDENGEIVLPEGMTDEDLGGVKQEGDTQKEPVVMTPESNTVSQTQSETMDIPGVLLPPKPEDYSSMAGDGNGTNSNQVGNLPFEESDARNDILDSAAALVDVQVEELPDELPPMVEDEANAPVEIESIQQSAPMIKRRPALGIERTKPSPAPVGTSGTGSEDSLGPVPDLPSNDINDLPDWAM